LYLACAVDQNEAAQRTDRVIAQGAEE